MEPLYKLTIVGVKAGRDIATIKSKLQVLVNNDTASITKILETLAKNGEVVAANDLPLSKIEQHKSALEDIGLQCTTEVCLSLSPIAEEKQVSVCPACASPLPEVESADSEPCGNCGIVPRKYLENQERRKMMDEERERLLKKQQMQADRDLKQAEIDEKERQKQQLREQIEQELGLRRKTARRKTLTIGATAVSAAIAVGLGAYTFLHRDSSQNLANSIETAGVGVEGQTPAGTDKPGGANAEMVGDGVAPAGEGDPESGSTPRGGLSPAEAVAKVQALTGQMPGGNMPGGNAAGGKGGNAQAAVGPEDELAVKATKPMAEMISLDLEQPVALARIGLNHVQANEDDAGAKLLLQSYSKMGGSGSSSNTQALVSTSERIKVEMLSIMAARQSNSRKSGPANQIFEKAGTIAAGIENPVEQVKAWSRLAQQQMAAKSKFSALENFQKAMATTRSITDPVQRIEALAIIGEEFAETGDLIRAQEFLDDVKTRAKNSSDHISAVVSELLQAKMLGAMAEAQMRIANSDSGRATFASAVEHARKIEPRGPRALALSIIALRQARSNATDDARKLATEAEELAQEFKSRLDQMPLLAEVKNNLVETYGTAANALTSQHKSAAADESFAQAMRAAQEMESGDYHGLMLSILAKHEKNAGLVDRSKFHFNEAARIAGGSAK